MSMSYCPSGYQKYATQFLIDHPHAGCFLQMGLGKTVITLTALQQLLQTGEVEKVLVIAPLNVARTVWAEEAAKWTHTAGIRCVKVLGSQTARIQALQQDADLYIINRENVPWLVEHIRSTIRWWPFDTIVIDELSSFKSGRSQRFRALCRTLRVVKRVIGLTGTPSPNGAMDLWSQIYLLDQGERLGKFITRFRDEFFTPGATNGHVVYSYIPKPGALEEIRRRISDICMSMSSEDWLELPEIIYRDVRVPLPPKVLKEYRTMARDMVLSLPDGDITAVNAAVVAGKLLQIASGAVYDEDKRVHNLHNEKLKALQEIIDVSTSPVLVFYGYKHEAVRILKAIPEAVPLRGSDEIQRWNAGEIPVLIAHPDSAGHGLNLQAGGHTIVWYSLTWSLEKYQQACARLWRRGQQDRVVVHHLVAEGTIDERVLRVLQGKDEEQQGLMKAVKALREEVLNYDS